jgi:glycosyltransferase involved in cell wall biosynthesis
MKKLLIIINSLGIGGAEKMLVNLVNRFSHEEFVIKIISLSNNNPLASSIEAASTEIKVLPRKWKYDLYLSKDIRQIINDGQIDTVLAFDLFSYFYVWIALQGIKIRPKIFISIHSTIFRNYKQLIQALLYARLLSEDVHIISVCDAQADYWSRTYFIPRKMFTTIFNGVDCHYFAPHENSPWRLKIRALHDIREDAVVILQVANLTPHKRQEDALAALKILIDKASLNSYFLLFVGSGTEEREKFLIDLASNLGILSNVRFCGAQNDVRPYYEAADLFTLTSNNETFSIAALEAMSMGLSCVLTDVGGAREMIVEGFNGRLVQANNPKDIASGWLSTIDNLSKVEHEKIRDHVINRFSIIDCVLKYSNLLGGNN